MKILFETKSEEIPAGKRSIRETKYGNTNAHVSGRYWKTIGPTYTVGTQEAADEFLSGQS